MQKISAVVSAYNEELKIEKCLRSLVWVDEIVVVDNSSADKTSEIARKMGAVVFEQPNDPLRIDLQKNTGIKKARNDWILLVDADEEITPDLKDEIKKLLSGKDLKNGYYIPRKNIIFGKQIEHSGWYPDHQLRLFRKGKGEFKSSQVHQSIVIEGETGYLKEHMLHQNYENISQFIQKNMIFYAKIQSESLLSENFELSPSDFLEKPAKEFISRFFARKGYKDGIHGLILSLLMASSSIIVLSYVWERQGFRKVSEQDMMKDIEPKFKKITKEVKYWLNTIKIDESKNPVKKISYKLKRKLR